MPDITPRLGLRKPLSNEAVTRAAYNENIDIIDQNTAKTSDLTAHLADKMQSGVHGIATTAALTLYVDTALGNDANTGLAAGAGNALKTIQAAINKAPQIVNHTITINVAYGTYPESILITGFTGKGAIIIKGGTDLTSAVNYLVNKCIITKNTININIEGFKVNIANSNEDFYASINAYVLFRWCITEAVTPLGFNLVWGKYFLYNCRVSNHSGAGVFAYINSLVNLEDCTGSNNVYGVQAQSNAVVSQNGANDIGKHIRGNIANTIIPYGGLILPLSTRDDFNLYVRSDGSDDNDGSVDDSAHALKTINEAIRRLPQRIDHAININVAVGTYAENVSIKGFVGTGTLNIIGGSNDTDALNYQINTVQIIGNVITVNINGFKFLNQINNTQINGIKNLAVVFNWCVVDAVTQFGAVVHRGSYYFNSCKVSNHTNYGVYSSVGGIIYLNNCYGSNSGYGIGCYNSGIIQEQAVGSTRVIRGTVANRIIVNGGIITPLSTETNVTLYVRTDGSDDNDGSIGNSLRTIGEAIRRLPSRIDHTVTINVGAGTYNENVFIQGFVGGGAIVISGGNSLATAVNYIVNSLTIRNTVIEFQFLGITLTRTGALACSIYKNYGNVFLQYIICNTADASFAGINIDSSPTVYIRDSNVSNRNYGINCSLSKVLSNTNTGTNNTYGLYASGGGVISKYGTQPGGSTAEGTNSGGVIR